MFIHKTNSNQYFSKKNTFQISFQQWYEKYDIELKNMFNITVNNIKKTFPKYTPSNEDFSEFVKLLYIKSSKN